MVRNLNDEMPPLRVPLFGKLDLFLQDPMTKEVIEERHTPNDIVDAGEIWIAELLAKEEYGGSALSFGAGELGWGIQYTHVGTVGDATLQTMYAMQGSTSGITTNYYETTVNDVSSPGHKVVSVSTYTTAHGNGALREAGLFSNDTYPQSSTDTVSRMFNRVNFATINKTDAFQLTLQWTIQIGSVA